MTPAEPRSVLIATLGLNAPNGTDLYTRDLALALLRRGWLPVVYTSLIGPVADELRRATIPVVDDLDRITAVPDVIHGHHALETLAALARFRDVPALFVCHDALAWHSVAPRSPRIRTYVAVDRNCRDRMIYEQGVPSEMVEILTNAVDLQRFRRRGPLPARPARALIFSNAATEYTFAAPIRAACAARGIEVDLAGLSSGRAVDRPEEVLPHYDLVFGKARCALEAAATGAAVVVCDARGLGGMITTERLDALRQLNFGARTLRNEITPETVGAEIDRYDPADAMAVCDRLRRSAGIDLLAEQYVALYEELCATPRSIPAQDELAELSRSLTVIARNLHSIRPRYARGVQRLRRIANTRPVAAATRALDRLMRRVGL